MVFIVSKFVVSIVLLPFDAIPPSSIRLSTLDTGALRVSPLAVLNIIFAYTWQVSRAANPAYVFLVFAK
jgi:hypothetical protein